MNQYTGDSSTNLYRFMKSSCKRSIQFIQYHISSHIFEMKQELDSIKKDPKLPLAQICKQTIFDSQMIKDA